MPFDDEIAEPKKGNIGIKNTNKSRFANQPKKPNPAQFSEAVYAKENKLKTNLKNIIEATTTLVSLFRNKKLKQNKDDFHVSLENETIQSFIDFCAEKNDDVDAQFNGEGSLTAISLLIKLSLEQKDRINFLEYKLSELEKMISNERNDSK